MNELQLANQQAINNRANIKADNLLGLYFPILDFGFISLVDYQGGDHAIARSARTSYQYGVNQRADDRSLIRYLLKHDHGSPFEFVQFTFHCQMPIFVARQWIRHRIAGVNEMSGRYSIMPLMFYSPDKEQVQAQSKSNKQGRDGGLSEDEIYSFLQDCESNREIIKNSYVKALGADVSREIARIDLPLSTYTNWYWTINLRSLMNFMTLRCDNHAQWEIRQYANLIAGVVKEVCPIAYEAWYDYQFGAQKFSNKELSLIINLINKNYDIKNINEHAELLGLSTREVKEFVNNILIHKDIQDFSLDISQAKTPEHFQKLAECNVPELKKSEVNNSKKTVVDEKYQNIICKTPIDAYRFVVCIPGANIEKCQEEACTSPEYAYHFANEVPGADIEKCQEAACKDPKYAYLFARDIPGANIEKCQEAACKDPKWAYYFALYIPGADKKKCRNACKGSAYAF
ncbi:MAG: FAD-dependent thymidylate synthase [Clostridia bacterium]